MEQPNRRNQRYCDHCNSWVSRGTYYNHRILYGKKYNISEGLESESVMLDQGSRAEESTVVMDVMEEDDEEEEQFSFFGRHLEFDTYLGNCVS